MKHMLVKKRIMCVWGFVPIQSGDVYLRCVCFLWETHWECYLITCLLVVWPDNWLRCALLIIWLRPPQTSCQMEITSTITHRVWASILYVQFLEVPTMAYFFQNCLDMPYEGFSFISIKMFDRIYNLLLCLWEETEKHKTAIYPTRGLLFFFRNVYKSIWEYDLVITTLTISTVGLSGWEPFFKLKVGGVSVSANFYLEYIV